MDLYPCLKMFSFLELLQKISVMEVVWYFNLKTTKSSSKEKLGSFSPSGISFISTDLLQNPKRKSHTSPKFLTIKFLAACIYQSHAYHSGFSTGAWSAWDKQLHH